MPTYYPFTLANGLRVVIQPNAQSHTVVVNILYRVGAAYEAPDKTGMAHLLEHIMFGGSRNVASYDKALQKVGGQNNAYTTTDVTNYWCKLPANKLPVALWLEADRLLAPSYHTHTVETQRKVVIEEFKQGYHNAPYGDVWHQLCDQAYNVHPYRWPTIGKNIDHLDQANMSKEEIIRFGKRFYTPNNAILTIVGGIDPDKAYEEVKKWFGNIPAHPNFTLPILPQEPEQKAPSFHTMTGQVPQDALYKTYHIPGRQDKAYIPLRVLSSLLSNGESSLLHQELVEKQALFTDISAYTNDTIDPGLFIINGKLSSGVTFEKAEQALAACIAQVTSQSISQRALTTAKNQEVSAYLFGHTEATAQAETLAYATLFGDSDFFVREIAEVKEVTLADVQKVAQQTFASNTSHTLYYKKEATR